MGKNEKRIAVITIVTTVIIGIGIWGLCTFNNFTKSKSVKMPLIEQEIIVTKVESDIEDLEVEVSLKEGEIPWFVVTYTNNTKEDVSISEGEVYYEESVDWKSRVQITVTESGDPIIEALDRPVVFCPESVERMAEELGITHPNTRTITYCPWENYHDMEELGNYRMLLELDGFETDLLGCVTIEWTQTEKK